MILLHAGFHKTATTTVQQALRENRGALAGWHVALEEDLPEIAATARAYSVTGDPFELTLLQALAMDWAAEQPTGNMIISCESLAGEMPGRPGGAVNYHRGADLVPCLVKALADVRQDQMITVYLSTRSAQGWLESLHWQCTRQPAMTEDFATFAARMAPHADLYAQAAAIRAACPVPVVAHDIGTLDNPLTPLLDIMQIPQAARAPFAAPRRMNARPVHVDSIALANQFATLNRGSGTAAELRASRQATMAGIWHQPRNRSQQ